MLEFILSFLGAFLGATVAFYLLPRGKPSKAQHKPSPAPISRLVRKARARDEPNNPAKQFAERKREWLYGPKDGES